MIQSFASDCWTMTVASPGPPSNLQRIAGRLGTPGRADLVLDQVAIGVNYHDVYVRSGQYSTMPFPGVPGIEATGVVRWVGSDVSDFDVGDRVAYITSTYGSYASRRILSAEQAVLVPNDIPLEVAAAALLKGVTADMLLSRSRVGPASVVVVHAAAGGVGQILIQMAKALGANVVGAVGNEMKADLVRSLGCEHVVQYSENKLVDVVREVSSGQGADVVFDGVGAATFDLSLSCLRKFGQLALFGQASGPVAPINVSLLTAQSLAVWRPVVFHHVADLLSYRDSAKRVFDSVIDGRLVIKPPAVLKLDQAAIAHDRLERGMTTGATVLTT